MSLQEKITDILVSAVEHKECAGVNVLVRRHDEEVLYTQAGFADIASRRHVQRDSIFRLFSQSKPVTAAAAMILIDRHIIHPSDPVEKYIPSFANPQVISTDDTLTPALRSIRIMDLLGMTSGVCYPDGDAAGQGATEVTNENHLLIRQGGGMTTMEFISRLGEKPLAFQPGTQWRYGYSADVLGAVVEAASGKSFGDFLQEEIFYPLDMKDTAFWVPPEKQHRFVTAYVTDSKTLTPWEDLNLCMGVYDRPPAFESGGAGLVSTIEDYSAFAQMLLNEGEYHGHRILSPAAARYLTSPQLTPAQLPYLWDGLAGYSYGKLMKVCTDPGQVIGLSVKGQYGWGGWLGTDFFNIPSEQMTILLMQNVTGGMSNERVKFMVVDAVLSALSMGQIK